MVKTKAIEKKITISLRGTALKSLIEILHKKEREVGLLQSATSIICEAIEEKYAREIQKEDTSEGKEIEDFFK